MNTSTLTIKNTYYDALFFASSTLNEYKDFHLTAAELRVLEKLIHYSKDQENITWTSENISKHIFTSPTSIDKSIQRLKRKGFINVSTTQRFEKVKQRTIFINWSMFEYINELIKKYQNREEESEPKEVEELKDGIETKYNIISIFNDYVKPADDIIDSRFDKIIELDDIIKKQFNTSNLTLRQLFSVNSYLEKKDEFDNEFKEYFNNEIQMLKLEFA